jgi:hypothetical protein
MSAAAVAAGPGFSDRITHLLERVDYRRADTVEVREDIFRLRYEAYLREGAIPPNFGKRLADDYDEMPNAWIFGIYIEDQLASSIRLHVATKDNPELPGNRVFSDILRPEIEAGRTVIDPTRFVADHNCTRLYPEVPYITVRLAWLASEYFQTDLLLATVRAEHQAFYKRVFGHKPICPPRPYPSLTKPISLMTLDYQNERERVMLRYPFFRSTFFERRMLFERALAVPQRAA